MNSWRYHPHQKQKCKVKTSGIMITINGWLHLFQSLDVVIKEWHRLHKSPLTQTFYKHIICLYMKLYTGMLKIEGFCSDGWFLRFTGDWLKQPQLTNCLHNIEQEHATFLDESSIFFSVEDTQMQISDPAANMKKLVLMWTSFDKLKLKTKSDTLHVSVAKGRCIPNRNYAWLSLPTQCHQAMYSQ